MEFIKLLFISMQCIKKTRLRRKKNNKLMSNVDYFVIFQANLSIGVGWDGAFLRHHMFSMKITQRRPNIFL